MCIYRDDISYALLASYIIQMEIYFNQMLYYDAKIL
jgi:hypothetical protein